MDTQQQYGYNQQWQNDIPKFEGTSEQKTMYTQKVLPPIWRHPALKYEKNPNKFEGVSTQVTDYREFELQTRKLGGPHKNNLVVGGEFSSRTENHDQYPSRELPDPYRHPNAVYVKNPSKFEGVSTNSSDYREFELQMRKLGGPHKNNLDVGGEFSSRTENHDQYPPRELPDPYRHPNAVYVKNLNKFEGVSTQVTDYREWQLPDRVICGPQPDNIGIGAKSLR